MIGEKLNTPLAIIGGGNMARAIVEGAVAAGVMDATRVVVAEPSVEKHGVFTRLGVRATRTATEAMGALVELEGAIGDAGQLVLAVKPQMLVGVAGEIRGLLGGRRRVVVTILAGTPSGKVRGLLGGSVGVVRAMPNTPARIGRGVTAIALGEGALPGDDEAARAIFGGVGPLVVAIEERLMDAFTALAGSGPAYVFYLAEAMARAGAEMGFSGAEADRIVRATVAGAAELLVRSDEPAASLRAAVTSKGGTTEAAVGVLAARGVERAVVEAIKAGERRGGELAGTG